MEPSVPRRPGSPWLGTPVANTEGDRVGDHTQLEVTFSRFLLEAAGMDRRWQADSRTSGQEARACSSLSSSQCAAS